VYTTCLRCERSLDRNDEIPQLPVGRRIAFDAAKGRLWVICRRCGQWNLTPLERRWEAIAECERLALAAESRVAGAGAGLARTQSGLELLRVGGMPDADIANWRYGRRLRTRQLLVMWTAAALAALALLLGVRAGQVAGSPYVGVHVAVMLAFFLLRMWSRPPRLWLSLRRTPGMPPRLWTWQLDDVRFEGGTGPQPLQLVVPGGPRGEVRLAGHAAAVFLADFLPRINGADSATVSLATVLEQVAAAEREPEAAAGGARGRGRRRRRVEEEEERQRATHRRPWERLAIDSYVSRVMSALPERRLALEIAVTEEVEAALLATRAGELAATWREEETVGAIADALLVPEAIDRRLEAMRVAHASDATPAHGDRPARSDGAAG
jgi:hypothetical protein